MFDAVSLHAYWSAKGLTPYNALLYRAMPRDNRPLFITECGWDCCDGYNAPDGRCGAYAQRQTDETVISGLGGFNAELLKDPNVYATAFTTSPTDDWDRKGFNLGSVAVRAGLMGWARVGLHDIRGTDPNAVEWARHAPIVKGVGNLRCLKAASPGAYTVYRSRLTLDNVWQDRLLDSGDPTPLVRGIIDELAGWTHPHLYVELLNEVTRERDAQYAALAARAIPMLHAAGLRVCGPSFSTGSYDVARWKVYGLDGGSHAMTPGNNGPRATTLGAMVHSTRSGQGWGNSQQEFDASVRWLSNPVNAASCHVVIGPDRKTDLLDKRLAAWHARDPVNGTHIGYELTQALPTDAYTDYQYKQLARELVSDHQQFGVPLVHVFSQMDQGIIGHEESENGKHDGKTDPGTLFDWGRLFHEIAALQPVGDDPRIVALRDQLWTLKDTAWNLGRKPLGDVVMKAVQADKGEIPWSEVRA